MKKIKYIILAIIILSLIFISYTYSVSNYIYPMYNQLNVTNLDNSSKKDEIYIDILDYLENNNLEMYTINGKMYGDQVINQFYSSFTDKEFYTSFYLIKSNDIPTESELVANYDTQSTDQTGYTNKYMGVNQGVEIRGLDSLRQITLDRIYYFPESTTENIEDISSILAKYGVESTYVKEDDSININIYNFLTIIYLLVIMLLLLIVETILDSKEIAIKTFNGYSLSNHLKERVSSYFTVSLLINLLLIVVSSIILIIITKDIIYFLAFFKFLLIMIVAINFLLLFLLIVCISISLLFIEITKIKDNVNGNFIIFFSYFTKVILLLIIFLGIGNLNEVISHSRSIRSQLEVWKKIDKYYFTGYYNDMTSPYDHIDFETMKLPEPDQKSKEFINLTEDKYNGIIMDAGNYGENYQYNKNVCEGVYTIDCNTIILNQNYLDLMQIKDENNDLININDNDKIDIIVPSRLKNEAQNIKEQIYGNLNSNYPSLKYKIDDFNIIIAKSGTCYQTFDTTTVKSCIDSVAIEMGDYYYNYSLLLATGRYFIKLNDSTNPYSSIEDDLVENDLDYNFYKYDNKTSSVYKEYKEIRSEIYKNIITLIFSFFIIIVISYYTIRIYISMKKKDLSINIIHGRRFMDVNKVLVIINILISLAMLIYFMNILNIFELLIVLILDNIITIIILKKVSKDKIISYIKGYND